MKQVGLSFRLKTFLLYWNEPTLNLIMNKTNIKCMRCCVTSKVSLTVLTIEVDKVKATLDKLNDSIRYYSD